jgi:DNA repair exonuclease SbcCD ATPase subunit
MTLKELNEKYQQSKGAYTQILERIDSINNKVEELNLYQQSIEKAQALIQLTAKETQEKLCYHIEDIVNMALDTCFPGEYNFVIDFQIKRGKTEAELYIEDKDGERINPMDSSGGGLVDILSFALRISAFTLDKVDNVIVLDEPMRFLSSNLKNLAGEILKKLSEKLSVQFLIVTHDNSIVDISDKVFEVKKKNKKSIVEVVK